MSKRATLNNCGLAAVLPLVFLVASCASVPTGASHANETEEHAKKEIERRLNEVFAACEKKDFDRLEGYHLYGPKFSRYSGSLPERLDADKTRKLEHDGLASLDGLKMQAVGLKIDVFSNTGIATFILRYSFNYAGRSVSKAERTTLVFVNVRGEWRIAHEHLSPIINAEQTVQPTGASRFAPRQSERHRRLAPVADRCVQRELFPSPRRNESLYHRARVPV